VPRSVSLVVSAPGRPRRLRTTPALDVNLPSRVIAALMVFSPARTRWRIMLRSNSANGTRNLKNTATDRDLARVALLLSLGLKVKLQPNETPSHGGERL